MTRAIPLIFFYHFFTVDMIDSIVNHTHSYALKRIFSGTHRPYAHRDGSWRNVTGDEIRRFIAFVHGRG